MKKVLGIDTGGTYTDAVIYDHKREKIIDKNKTLTTHHHLITGIKNSILGLDENNRENLDFVSLSTTLATNAIVENKGCSVGLLLLGMQPQQIKKFRFDREIPTESIEYARGKFDVNGSEIEPLAVNKIKNTGKTWQSNIESVSITGYMSIRNPRHEKKARSILENILDVPIVCSHELTGKLNMIERAATVVLNASLIPLIKNLLANMETVLADLNIEAPLFMMKGDGTLANKAEVRHKPIETVMSGPAASVLGAKYLSQEKNAAVIDMGGTTTDIAILNSGRPRLNKAGAEIEGWATSVESIDLKTAGIGGDSEITIEANKDLKIGPERVVPYSLAAHRNENIIAELKNLLQKDTGLKESQFLALKREPDIINIDLNQREQDIIEILQAESPVSMGAFKEKLDLIKIKFLRAKRLQRKGIVNKIGLTPTDFLHITDKFNPWSIQAAELGWQIMKNEIKYCKKPVINNIDNKKITEMEGSRVAEFIIQKTTKNIAENMAVHLLDSEKIDLLNDNSSGEAEIFFQTFGNFSLDFNLNIPAVALGAPAKNYLANLDDFFDTEIFIPDNFAVANAIGTTIANIIKQEKLLIKKNEENYTVYSRDGKQEFNSFNKAISQAKEMGREITINQARAAGAINIDCECEVLEEKLNFNRSNVLCTAVGKPIDY